MSSQDSLNRSPAAMSVDPAQDEKSMLQLNASAQSTRDVHGNGAVPTLVSNEANSIDQKEVARDDTSQEKIEEQDEPEDESKYPGGLKLLLLLVGLALATFVIALDNTIIATAIPKITSVFDSLDDVGWYGSAYLLTTTALQPTFGKIYTFYSVKWTFLIALVIFEVGSIICAAATSSVMFIIGRAIAGVGAAALFSGGMIIVGHIAPLRKRAMYISILASMFGVSSVVGPLLGGVFADQVSWRWCFWINLPFGGVTFATVFMVFENPKAKFANMSSKEKLSRMDPFGALCLISGVVCLLLALQWGGTTYPWSESKVWGCLLGFGLLTLVFVGLQIYRGERATIPPRIITQRSVAASCAFTALLSMCIYGVVFYMPFYFQAVKGTSAEASGIRTIPFLVSITVASLAVGGSITYLGWYTPFMWAGSSVFVVGAGLLYTLKIDSTDAQWAGYQLLAGFGAGTAVQVPFVAAQVVVPTKDMPTANSLVVFFNSLGGALSISIAQNIFSNSLAKQLALNVPATDAVKIINAGATNVVSVTPPQFLADALSSYNTAVTNTFILAVVAGSLAFIDSLFMEWKSVKGKKLSPGGME